MTKDAEANYFQKIQRFMEDRIGLHPDSLSQQNWESCLQNRMQACRVESYGEYFSCLLHSVTEIQELTDLIVIPETWFFREERAFKFLTEYINRFGEDHRKGNPLKILSLGCSTGEEPYSIVICLLEAGMPLGSFRVEGVDVSKHSLSYAQKGIYGPNSFRNLRTKLRNRYFTEDYKKFQLNDEVRFTVKFKKANVVDFPSGMTSNKYDIIFCRNLLIYLTPTLQGNLLKRIERALVPKGILILGEMENDKIAKMNFEKETLSLYSAYRKKAGAAESNQLSQQAGIFNSES